ncbi:MAG TPA: hypothetical protein PKD85_03990, partial [Saprospiraceae bacterium]|nr:hypothetical protein [Saprospiraceae bacterium]
TPSTQSWGKLEGLLEQQEPPKVINISYRRWAAVVMIFLVALAGVVYFMPAKEEAAAMVVAPNLLINEVDVVATTLSENQKEIPVVSTSIRPNVNQSISHRQNAETSREEVNIATLPQKDIPIYKGAISTIPTIDAQSIVNEEINKILVNSVNPKINSELIVEVKKLDLALLLEEMNQDSQEQESQFRKKVVKKLQTIYAQISDRNIIKE